MLTTGADASLGRSSRNRVLSTPALRRADGERQPLVRRRSLHEYETGTGEPDAANPTLAGGTVLGIHNLAIVMPQFIVSPGNLSFLSYKFVLMSGCSGDECHLPNR